MLGLFDTAATKIKVQDIDESRTLDNSMVSAGVVGDLTIEEFALLLAHL